MAQKICQKCGEGKSLAHFIAIENSIMHDKQLPICRECIKKLIAESAKGENKNQTWNVVNKICQWADVPFISQEWEKCYQGYGADGFGPYCLIFRSEEYKTLQWDQYNDIYLQLLEEQRVEDAIPELREKKMEDLRKKWGNHYDEEEIEYLENLHQGILNSQNVVGALNEDQALKMCKISLIIEDKMREGIDFSKDLKAYDELAKLSNLTPKNVKEANEFDSFGEVFAYMEKTGTELSYYDGAIRDEVDYTMKNMKNWVRYLYTNETGVAEEIEQRIQNLKVAAELEGEEFDEADYRRFQKSVEEDDEEEEFKLELS